MRCSTSISSDRATSSGDSTTCTAWAPRPERPALAAVVAASDYVTNVNALIERVGAAADQATLLTLLQRCAQTLGADNAVFVSFVRDHADVSACRFMLACSPAWCQHYLDADCIAHDPWLAYAAHHGEPVVASTLQVDDQEARQVVELAAAHGFASAVLVPVHSGAGHSRISLLCLGTAQTGYFEADGFHRFRLGARLLAGELHDWWMRRIRHELLMRAHLTPADLALLRHEYQGHSSKRIAADLDVSACSINSRFQRLNEKLGVANRRTAARLAAEYGLLD